VSSNIAQSTAYAPHSPKAGKCDVTDSVKTGVVVAPRVLMVLMPLPCVSGAFVGASSEGEYFAGLEIPTETVGSFNYTLALNNYAPTISADGAISFIVFGTMRIPDT